VGQTLRNLANLYLHQGKHGEAEGLYKRALVIREKALGANHRDVGHTLNNLANLYLTQGKYSEAEGLYERALIIREKALGATHPTTKPQQLALVYGNEPNTRRRGLFQRALNIRKRP
jgi:tetratricopeptide (TPR) repeat protein